MAKRLLTLSLLLGMVGLAIAAHQWFGWNYWNLKQQFSLYHHEGLALLFIVMGVGMAIASLLMRKRGGAQK
jgi:Na+/H+ antiporter NhaC